MDDGTANQTVGPFFHIGLSWLFRDDLPGAGFPGERITVAGRVLDGEGAGVADALIELWQADPDGRYPDPAAADAGGARFQGFGRVPTDSGGAFRFTTVRPGRVPAPGGGLQAPHVAVAVFMRGLLRHLVTRMYFPHDPAHHDDPILERVPAERRATLVARSGDDHLSWDIVLQGDRETVFFDV